MLYLIDEYWAHGGFGVGFDGFGVVHDGSMGLADYVRAAGQIDMLYLVEGEGEIENVLVCVRDMGCVDRVTFGVFVL